MTNEHKKIISWRDTKDIKKSTVSRKKVRNYQRRRINLEIDEETNRRLNEDAAIRKREGWSLFNIDVNNLIKWWVKFHWPKCRICESNFAPYDRTVCTLCTDAMERLKQK